MEKRHSDKVAVLLCCYKGKKYIAEQIDSIVNQDHQNFSLWVSIDGEDDGSREIIQERTKGLGKDRVHFLKGPGKGFGANFWSLLCHPEIEADYYSFSDQDDIWENTKISRAIEFLKTVPSSTPAVYGSRLTYMKATGELIGESPLFKKKPTFENALVQNMTSGNTMMLNKKARDILTKHIKADTIVFHDWISYLAISAIGGQIFYDSFPSLRYRQHGKNFLGENRSVLARMYRLKGLLSGTFKGWNDKNMSSLRRLEDQMTPENKRIFRFYDQSRNKWILPRLFYFLRAGVYRQTLIQNIGLYLACILKRV